MWNPYLSEADFSLLHHIRSLMLKYCSHNWQVAGLMLTQSTGNRVSTSLGNSGLCWTVFARNKDTAVPAEGNGDLQTLICVLVARPRQCLTLSNPVPWQNWVAAYLGYTLRMRTLFRGWPIMVNDTHTRRRSSLSLAKYQTVWANIFSSTMTKAQRSFFLNDFFVRWSLFSMKLGMNDMMARGYKVTERIFA